MSKIKLLILLLISLLLASCIKDDINRTSTKFSLAYVGGELDGLIFKNLLTGYLEGLNLYDKNSIYEINAETKHNSNLYITNQDNTSDRQNITTSLSINIENKTMNCSIFQNKFSVSQFYIFAPSSQFISNQKATSKIKKSNSEALVKEFVNKLFTIDGSCSSEKSN